VINLENNEIDWEDESGLIAFRELEKRNEIRERTKQDILKVIDFTTDDWILLLLYSNGGSLKRTPIFKLLCIFGERTGLNDIFGWYLHECGTNSSMIENALEDLVSSNTLDFKVMKNQDGYIFKNFQIKDKDQAEFLWNLLPESIKSVLVDLREEFKDKRVDEIVDYTHDAYPEYVIKL
jgi:hypothetical protein